MGHSHRSSTRTSDNPERPAVHVSLARGVDERLYEWIAVGAEEEGVPCRLVPAGDDGNVAALANAAAQSSRLGVGVALASGRIAVHERHMPVARPVVVVEVEEDRAAHVCRLAGCNAARLVTHTPLRLDEEP